MAILQPAVARYRTALSNPYRLFKLHPSVDPATGKLKTTSAGNTGNAAAIAPALVLMSISAFEGFIEELTAAALLSQGQSYSRIAKVVGKWTNPDITKWRDELNQHFQVKLSTGFSVRTTRGVPSGNWSSATVNLTEAAKLGEAWMNVRHALTHGAAAGRGAELWPPPMNAKGEPVGRVLRPATDPAKHHLEFPGARGCASLYLYAARHGADRLAAKLGEPALNWSDFPDFDPPSPAGS